MTSTNSTNTATASLLDSISEALRAFTQGESAMLDLHHVISDALEKEPGLSDGVMEMLDAALSEKRLSIAMYGELSDSIGAFVSENLPTDWSEEKPDESGSYAQAQYVGPEDSFENEVEQAIANATDVDAADDFDDADETVIARAVDLRANGDDDSIPVETTVAKSNAPHPEPKPGLVLRNRFQLEQEVARGSCCIIFRATDLLKQEVGSEDTDVAIKIIKPEFADDQKVLRAFHNEVAQTRNLSHPNIIDQFEVDSDGFDTFVTMEWLEGESLADFLDRHSNGPLTVVQTDAIVDRLSDALAYAHEHEVVHADVKPGNVFLTRDGSLKLLDFGVAISTDSDAGEVDAWSDVPAALTPAYSSCERLENVPPTSQDDLFSLACLTYRLLSGHRVFGSMTALEAEAQGTEPARIEGLDSSRWQALLSALAFRRADRTSGVEVFSEQFLRNVPDDEAASAVMGAQASVEGEKARLAEEAGQARLAEEAEQARLAVEAEQARLAEEAEQAEQARLAEEAEQARLAEEAEQARLAEEAEQARLAEEAEQARLAEEAEQARLAEEAEQARLAEEAEQAEQARLAEEAEQARLAEEAEQARLAEKAEQARLAEEAEQARLAEEAEQARLAEEAEQARLAEEAEQARLAEEAEQARLAEEAEQAEQARLAEEAEQARLAEEAEQARVAEEERIAEEAKLAEEADEELQEGAEAVAEIDDDTVIVRIPDFDDPFADTHVDELAQSAADDSGIGEMSDEEAIALAAQQGVDFDFGAEEFGADDTAELDKNALVGAGGDDEFEDNTRDTPPNAAFDYGKNRPNVKVRLSGMSGRPVKATEPAEPAEPIEAIEPAEELEPIEAVDEFEVIEEFEAPESVAAVAVTKPNRLPSIGAGIAACLVAAVALFMFFGQEKPAKPVAVGFPSSSTEAKNLAASRPVAEPESATIVAAASDAGDSAAFEEEAAAAAEQQAEEQRMAAERAAAEQQAEEQRVAAERAADEQAAAAQLEEQQRIAAEQQAAEARADAIRIAEARVAEQRATEQRLAEQQAAERRAAAAAATAAVQKAAAERAAADQRVAEKLTAQRIEELRAADQRAADQRFAEQQADAARVAAASRVEAERLANEQKAAAEQAEEQRLADRQLAAAAKPAVEFDGRVSMGELELVSYREPEHPLNIGNRAYDGWVDVEFVVDKKGRVKRADVVGSDLPERFERPATTAVRKWVFQPYRHNSDAVEVTSGVRLRFQN